MSFYENLAAQGFLRSLRLLSCLYCSPMQAHIGWLYSGILTDTTSHKFLYAWGLGIRVQTTRRRKCRTGFDVTVVGIGAKAEHALFY